MKHNLRSMAPRGAGLRQVAKITGAFDRKLEPACGHINEHSSVLRTLQFPSESFTWIQFCLHSLTMSVVAGPLVFKNPRLRKNQKITHQEKQQKAAESSNVSLFLFCTAKGKRHACLSNPWQLRNVKGCAGVGLSRLLCGPLGPRLHTLQLNNFSTKI